MPNCFTKISQLILLLYSPDTCLLTLMGDHRLPRSTAAPIPRDGLLFVGVLFNDYIFIFNLLEETLSFFKEASTKVFSVPVTAKRRVVRSCEDT